eukprot:scaffold1818_cov162-Amphora_coffeaeformis.AAC.4
MRRTKAKEAGRALFADEKGEATTTKKGVCIRRTIYILIQQRPASLCALISCIGHYCNTILSLSSLVAPRKRDK